MPRFPLRLVAFLMCGTMLSACETTSTPEAADLAGSPAAMSGVAGSSAITLDSEVQRAQMLRANGQFTEATQTLSQLMLAAPDDARVVGEYGKVLAQQGRAQDAVAFLRRAIELSSNDYSLYSALGVAEDQLGDQAAAKIAYETALKLKPDDPVVLNNYAMSRMLAGDPATANTLIDRAHAGADGNAQITRNVALVEKIAPAPAPQAAKAPEPVAAVVVPPKEPVVTAPLASVDVAKAPTPDAKSTPRPLSKLVAPGVVSQAVPKDPLAGPDATKKADDKQTADADGKTTVKTSTAPLADSIPQLRQTADASIPN